MTDIDVMQTKKLFISKLRSTQTPVVNEVCPSCAEPRLMKSRVSMNMCVCVFVSPAEGSRACEIRVMCN